jgi:hypothetical protein
MKAGAVRETLSGEKRFFRIIIEGRDHGAFDYVAEPYNATPTPASP